MLPREIPLESIKVLQKIYEYDSTKHLVILSTFNVILKRIAKFPELSDRLKVYSLSDEWQSDGAFLIIINCSDAETFVFFDSLNDSALDTLKDALKSLDYSILINYFSVRNVFRSMALEIIDELNMEIFEKTNAVCYYLAKDVAKNLEFTLPPNLNLASLTEANVEKINNVWPHRYEDSDKFISYSIKHHLSLGLFDSSGELLGWCLMYDNGSLAVLQVDSNHFKKGYGSLIVKAMSKKVATEFNFDVTSFIVPSNEKSINMFLKIGFQATGGHTWLIMKNKK